MSTRKPPHPALAGSGPAREKAKAGKRPPDQVSLINTFSADSPPPRARNPIEEMMKATQTVSLINSFDNEPPPRKEKGPVESIKRFFDNVSLISAASANSDVPPGIHRYISDLKDSLPLSQYEHGKYYPNAWGNQQPVDHTKNIKSALPHTSSLTPKQTFGEGRPHNYAPWMWRTPPGQPMLPPGKTLLSMTNRERRAFEESLALQETWDTLKDSFFPRDTQPNAAGTAKSPRYLTQEEVKRIQRMGLSYLVDPKYRHRDSPPPKLSPEAIKKLSPKKVWHGREIYFGDNLHTMSPAQLSYVLTDGPVGLSLASGNPLFDVIQYQLRWFPLDADGAIPNFIFSSEAIEDKAKRSTLGDVTGLPLVREFFGNSQVRDMHKPPHYRPDGGWLLEIYTIPRPAVQFIRGSLKPTMGVHPAAGSTFAIGADDELIARRNMSRAKKARGDGSAGR